MDVRYDVSKYLQVTDRFFYNCYGKVAKVVGLTVESIGPEAKLGDLCRIVVEKSEGIFVMAEVVGFHENRLLLMPYESMDGIGVGCVVENMGHPLTVSVGNELLGHTLDGLGRPTDTDEELILPIQYPADRLPPDPMKRKIIDQVLPLGVKAVDGLLTVGRGQRIGIFAGSGVGKSTLMGMFARNTKADINVIALIGERGREVREFIERDLGPEGMARSVVVVATSDKPALIRKKAAMTATAIAEYFRDQGRDVLLMMDSLTRFSMAQREIGLASGEPPVTRGYPPSVYAELPKLLERAGTSERGSITGLYTVLVDGDDFNEPITDTARGILDGHIVLNRKLAQKNHYPAIDVLASISRVMSAIASKEQKEAAGKLKNVMATYAEAEDLINIGAYKKGSNREIDDAIAKNAAVNQYLLQRTDEKFEFEQEVEMLKQIFAN
ncbi:MAG: flagellar protein export ATPase FliI [Lachnospiraceae bacterium]|nr:flagellar protein export ATPase FliI [Lachnospiraceae bacterium]MDD7178344.1 flagellar protein export ATPase FliI [bacterium]MDY5516023.1 flagellar protein export ATPase FliI [Lachnospiraceae bacterium]